MFAHLQAGDRTPAAGLFHPSEDAARLLTAGNDAAVGAGSCAGGGLRRRVLLFTLVQENHRRLPTRIPARALRGHSRLTSRPVRTPRAAGCPRQLMRPSRRPARGVQAGRGVRQNRKIVQLSTIASIARLRVAVLNRTGPMCRFAAIVNPLLTPPTGRRDFSARSVCLCYSDHVRSAVLAAPEVV